MYGLKACIGIQGIGVHNVKGSLFLSNISTVLDSDVRLGCYAFKFSHSSQSFLLPNLSTKICLLVKHNMALWNHKDT